MLSIRALARTSARTLPRLATTSFRPNTIARPACTILKASSIFVARPAFSTTALRRDTAGETDSDLAAKLQVELDLETDVKEDAVLPASIKDFIENGPFKVTDIEGKDDVVLTREFGDEKITVTFSIADLANFDEDMYNEEDDMEEGVASEVEDEDDEEVAQPGPPCRLHVVIEKPGKSTGALNVEATCTETGIMIENFHYYKKGELAHSETVEQDYASQGVYPGPPFGSLDEDLQILVERYLEERGITQALAVFVADYMEYKEQKEYMTWLTEVKGFIDA